MAALLGCLALGLPGTSSAQALGTMQVAARVVPASVGWTGLAEAGVAARSGGRGLLIVTIQHPHN